MRLKNVAQTLPRRETSDIDQLVSATADQLRLWTGVAIPVEVLCAAWSL
jgi:hypothetical protein